MSELNDAVEVAKLDPASGWRLGNDANRLMMESKSISISRSSADIAGFHASCLIAQQLRTNGTVDSNKEKKTSNTK